MTEKFHPIRDQIVNKLSEALSPLSLNVIDDSHKHIGHSGHNGVGESHFRVEIVSSRFEGLNRVARHQLVYKVLEDLIPPVHALQIKAILPSEAAK